jgi:predicted nucleic acid-binding protein
MNDRYLIDTSVWIFALRTKYVPKIKSYVERLLDEDKVVINPIIKLELLAGTKTRNEFARLKLRLDALQEISIDQEIWEESQKIAFDLRKKGIKIPNIDIIILSCAKIHKITLVHRDKHFDLAGKILPIKLKSFIDK